MGKEWKWLSTKRRSFVVVSLMLVMVLSLMVGCGNNNNTKGESPKPTNTPKQTEAPPEVKKEDVKIVFWHYLNDRKDLLEKMAADYQAKTGVQVDVQLFGGDGFKEKITAAAQTKTLPDIFTFAGGEGDLAKIIEINGVMEIGKEKADLLTKFPQNLVDKYSYKADNIYKVTELGTYALPMDTNNMQFLYNKDLFAQAGIAAAPATWKEFLDAIDKLNAKGIAPLATGLGSWVGTSMTEPYMFNYLGKDKLLSTKQGKEPMVGSEWESVLGLYAELAEHKAFAQGIATMDLPKAEELFVNGKVAMIFDGSWAIGVFNGMNKEFVNYGVFSPPRDERASHDVKIPGGVGVPLVVGNGTEHKQETLDFLEFLLSKEQQELYAAESFNLPANSEATGGNLSEALTQFAKGAAMIYETPGSFTPEVEVIMQKGIQLIILGEATPAEIVKQMHDKTKDNVAAGKLF